MPAAACHNAAYQRSAHLHEQRRYPANHRPSGPAHGRLFIVSCDGAHVATPTSNRAKRGVRPAKTQQKISGRLSCEQVTGHRYAIGDYICTAAKHGQNALTALRSPAALRCRPFPARHKR